MIGTVEGRQAQQITLPVEGMTCAACQANVQRALSQAPGVEKAAVNLMTHEATVTYDPALTSPASLVAAVNATGYTSRLPDVFSGTLQEDEARESAHAREYRDLIGKALFSLALGLAAMLASMPLMSGAGEHTSHSADPLIAWSMRVVDPLLRTALPWLYVVDPGVLRYGLLAMAIVVMAWAGRRFYVRAWSGLRHGNTDMNTLIAVGTVSTALAWPLYFRVLRRTTPVAASTVTFIVLRSGAEGLGRWSTERRDVAGDYRSVYGETPDDPKVIAISVDTNDTHSTAAGLIGPIAFVSR